MAPAPITPAFLIAPGLAGIIGQARRDSGPRIVWTGRSIAEDASLGDPIGSVLSVANGAGGDWSFAITSDPDSVVDLDVDQVIVDAALDYETATSHTIEITATDGNAIYDPVVQSFVFQVSDVVESGFPDNESGASEYQLLFAA